MAHIKVTNWDKFQHYHQRNPPWIKLYNALLDNDEFRDLPDETKAHLILIWMLASRKNNFIRYDAQEVKAIIGAKKPINFDLLFASKFIELDASKVDSTSAIAPVEKRRVEKRIPPISPKGIGFQKFWEAYPRKEAKANAIKAWNKIDDPDSILPKMLSAIAMKSKSSDWTKDGGQYIPLPASWLNAGRWDDEPLLKLASQTLVPNADAYTNTIVTQHRSNYNDLKNDIESKLNAMEPEEALAWLKIGCSNWRIQVPDEFTYRDPKWWEQHLAMWAEGNKHKWQRKQA